MDPKIRHQGRSELRQAGRLGNGLLVSVFVFSIFVNLLMLTGPLFMLQVYDRVLSSQSVPTLVALFALVTGLFVLMGFLDYARGRVLARYGARFQNALDRRIFDAVLDQDQFRKENKINRSVIAEMDALQRFISSPVILALCDLPWTPFFIALIFVFHPLLGFLALAGGAVLVIAALINALVSRNAARNAAAQGRQSSLIATETLQQPEIIRAQGMRDPVYERWKQSRDKTLGSGMRGADVTGSFASFSKSFRMLLQSAMLAAGAWLVLGGELTAGAMIAGSILLGRALAPVDQTISQWQMIQQARMARQNLTKLLEDVPTHRDTVGLPKPEAKIAIKNLSVRAPDSDKILLAGINLTVKPGEVIGVIGKSGSGKSTLARSLMGLQKPIAGELRLDGATLSQYSEAEIGAAIGYLPQDVSLFPVSVFENIARMALVPDQDKVQEAAIKAKAHEMIKELPQGYKTIIGPNHTRLSGGQKQRIALARALYDNPSILILDEPNSALDSDGSAALNDAIRDYKTSNRAVILMTHRPVAIAECDRLIVINAGQIVADGPKEEVLKRVLQNAADLKPVVLKRGGKS